MDLEDHIILMMIIAIKATVLEDMEEVAMVQIMMIITAVMIIVLTEDLKTDMDLMMMIIALKDTEDLNTDMDLTDMDLEDHIILMMIIAIKATIVIMEANLEEIIALIMMMIIVVTEVANINMIHMMIIVIKATIAIIDLKAKENTEEVMAIPTKTKHMVLKVIMIRTSTQTFMMIITPKPKIINIERFKQNSKLI